jgi:hypothetical protein
MPDDSPSSIGYAFRFMFSHTLCGGPSITIVKGGSENFILYSSDFIPDTWSSCYQSVKSTFPHDHIVTGGERASDKKDFISV